MNKAEKAKALAILKENSKIIKADGEEFFKNLNEDDKFVYLISDMVSGKAEINEDDGEDGGVRIALPMEKGEEIKIEKATAEELEQEEKKRKANATDETMAGSADMGEMGAGSVAPQPEEYTQENYPENGETEQENTKTEPVSYAEPQTNFAHEEPVVSGDTALDSDIEAELNKMKEEGLVQDNSQIVIEQEPNEEEYGAPEYVQEEPKMEEPAYSEPEQATYAEEQTQEASAEEPKEETDLDKEIREEMERMKNEGLVQDNSKIVVEKYEDEEKSY